MLVGYIVCNYDNDILRNSNLDLGMFNSLWPSNVIELVNFGMGHNMVLSHYIDSNICSGTTNSSIYHIPRGPQNQTRW